MAILACARVNHLVITGGGGGLARAVVAAFNAPDWSVRAPVRAELDVTDPAAVAAYFSALEVDLLVCAAGVTRDAPLARLREDDRDEVLAVNFHGAAACAAAVLPGMIRRGSGHLVFISSRSAIHPPAGQTAYAAAKAALLGLSEALARENGRHGIRSNVILPGFLETAMTATVSSARKSEVLAEHALGSFNTPAAVADFIRHLHHSLPHTSGQVFQLDSRPA